MILKSLLSTMSLKISGGKTFLRENLEKYSLVYRSLLRRKGASFHPDKVSGAWMNTTLKSEREWQEAVQKIKQAGLHPHPDDPKNWDALGALDFILRHTNRSARVLDAGGEVYSPLIEWLFLYGYKFLHVINLSFNHDFARGPVQYIRGDCADTPYPSEYFGTITCLSVIEHGVHIEKFLHESYRILRSGGLLIVSTDYWKDPIGTTGKKAYGTRVRVFTRKEIQELIDRASSIGFMPTGEIDYSTEEKVIHWKRVGLDFTFIVFALTKV